jgi:hypothetical protein
MVICPLLTLFNVSIVVSGSVSIVDIL